MVRLFIDVGRKSGVRPGDIVGAIANEARISGSVIGVIDIYDTYSFVEVPEDQVRNVIDALSQSTIKGMQVRPTIARPEADGAKRPRNDGRAGRDGRGAPPRKRRSER
jgi:ATP-dependent RNA helicase DeaD